MTRRQLVKQYSIRTPRGRARIILKKVIKPLLIFLKKSSLMKVTRRKLVKEVVVLKEIDFEKSAAYTLGHSIPFGAIYLNVKGRDPNGFIKKGKEYEALKEKIIGELKNLCRDIDRDVEVKIFDPRGIYWGDHLNEAPDVLFTVNNWKCIVVKNFSDFVYKDEPYSNRHTGSHRVDGIFLAYGPDIKRERIKGARIFDIAPTILHMLTVSIPENVDGRVLKEIFRDESEPAKRKPRYLKFTFRKGQN